MAIPKLGTIPLFSLAAVTAVLAPVRFSTADAVVASTAECTTCCSKAGSLCVVCASSCVAVENAYDSGSGPCQNQH